MSKVISFRLDPDNPREAEALTVLCDRLSQGFSTRHTITEALLMLDSGKSQPTEKEILSELSHQIYELREKIGLVEPDQIKHKDNPSKIELSDGFVSSIINSVKPGSRTYTGR